LAGYEAFNVGKVTDNYEGGKKKRKIEKGFRAKV
jgi:hypothetical protein